MTLTTIGPPLAHSRIATLFPRHRTVITAAPLHSMQRDVFVAHLNEQRLASGDPAYSPSDIHQILSTAVDLIVSDGTIEIRPSATEIGILLEADEVLQSHGGFPKHRIRFLNVNAPVVREFKRRGELWRVSPPPMFAHDFDTHRVAIGLDRIYYYNRYTGTRYVTLATFAGLASLAPERLAAILTEIGRYQRLKNRFNRPELAFFPPGCACEERRWKDLSPETLAPDELVALHREMTEAFRAVVPPHLWEDNPHSARWREAMISALTAEEPALGHDRLVAGLGPEFFRLIRWLAGVQCIKGEMVRDSLFDYAEAHPEDRAAAELCQPTVQGLILNLVREFSELEFVNIGMLGRLGSRPKSGGRRAVYIAEVKARDQFEPVLRIVRFLRWGIREHLTEGKSLLQSIFEAHEYKGYVLDRRLACRQLGMLIPYRVSPWDLSEPHPDNPPGVRDPEIWATYFERDFIPGTSTDKLADELLRNPDYALRLAGLLGRAAAANLIVGRTTEGNFTRPAEPIFDEGDEVIVEDDEHLPAKLIVCDHNGSFAHYQEPLVGLARAYAGPANRRSDKVPDPRQFAEEYLRSLETRFREIQSEVRQRPMAFLELFAHQAPDPKGNFSYRWLRVLDRLKQTRIEELILAIRRHIAVLPLPDPPPHVPESGA